MTVRSGGLRLSRNRTVVVGGGIVLLLAIFALLAPSLARHDPFTSDFVRAQTPKLVPIGPSAEFWLGADRLYRDQFARLAAGARLSLFIGVASSALSCTLGAAVGMVAGYAKNRWSLRPPWLSVIALALAVGLLMTGRSRAALAAFIAAAALAATLCRLDGALSRGPDISVDGLLLRLVDMGLALPFMLLVMALSAATERASVGTISLVLGFTGWLGVARLVFVKTAEVCDRDFILASRALGQTALGIVTTGILPNVVGPLLVVGTLAVGQMILAESTLGYLGVGLAPPTPSWGQMLWDGQDSVATAPWLVWGPGACILLAVVGFNLLGEGLRDVVDPRS